MKVVSVIEFMNGEGPLLASSPTSSSPTSKRGKSASSHLKGISDENNNSPDGEENCPDAPEQAKTKKYYDFLAAPW